jgi:hypothetical protein
MIRETHPKKLALFSMFDTETYNTIDIKKEVAT